MIYVVKDFLDDQKIKKLNELYDSADFEEGRMNGDKIITDHKNNKEILYSDNKHSYYHECEKILIKAVNDNVDFKELTALRYYGVMIFSEYSEGMYYHSHNDFYKMRDIRTDYSCTVALNSPEEYEGGELFIDIGDREIPYKLNPGELVLYPTGFSHRVNTVTSGKRRVAVFWAESSIRDRTIREMHQDMYIALRDHGEEMKDNKNLHNRLMKVKFNLMRNYGEFGTKGIWK